MTRPICGHCGKPYGQRWTKTVTVRWTVPTKDSGVTYKDLGGEIVMHRIVADDGATPPPPYQGNGIVVKETTPHLSSDGQMAMSRYIWDGESYYGGYKPFCTLRCALDYARKAFARDHARDNIRRVK